MELKVGTTVGGCVIEELLGAGGMGTVYAARQASLRRSVAIKVLSADGLPTLEAVRRFEREGELQAKLVHPHLVTVFDRGREGDLCYITMELVAGRGLGTPGMTLPLEPARVVRLVAQVAAALAYLHAERVLHRDIKPANILVTDDDMAKLGDFGLARELDMTMITQAAGMLGTVRYLAPEVLAGADFTPAADVYSLGLALLEMLTGTNPFAGLGPRELADMHERRKRVSLEGFRPKLRPELVALAAAMLDPSPENRPGAGSVVARLELLHESGPLAGRTARLSTSSPSAGLAAHAGPRHSLVAPAAFAAGALVMALIGAIDFRRPTEPVKIPGVMSVTSSSSDPMVSPLASPGGLSDDPVEALRESLLTRFEARLIQGGERRRVIRPRSGRSPEQEGIWQAFDPTSPPPGTRLFRCVVLDPSRLEVLILEEADPREPAPASVRLNGHPVTSGTSESGAWHFEAAPENAVPGLNTIEILSGAEGPPSSIQVVEKLRNGGGTLRRTYRPPPASELLHAGPVMDEMIQARFTRAQELATEFLEANGGAYARHLLIGIRLATARTLTSLDHTRSGISETISGMTSEVPPLRKAIALAGDSMRQTCQELVKDPASPLFWRDLGEALCLAGDSETGYDCMMYGCLLAPDFAHSWVSFYLAYDAGAMRGELLTRRIEEVRETLQVVLSHRSRVDEIEVAKFAQGAMLKLPAEPPAGGSLRKDPSTRGAPPAPR